MDLLSDKKNDDPALQQKILTELSVAGITAENMKIAKEFFDFSKERDLNLLDKIKRQCLNKNRDDIDCEKYNLLFTKGEECSVRWTLFLDALGGSTAESYLFPCDYEDSEDYKFLFNIFRIKYSYKLSAAKIVALFPFTCLKNSFREKPEILYMAASECCTEDESYAKVGLYSYIIAYCRDSGYVDENRLRLMCDCIVDKLSITQFENGQEMYINKKAVFAFMALCDDDRIYELLRKFIKRKSETISDIMKFVENGCIMNNLDKLLSIVDNDFDSAERIDFIKTALYNGIRSEKILYADDNDFVCHILKYMARKYPEEFSYVMLDDAKLPGTDNYCFCYYRDMYYILEKNNPGYLENLKDDLKGQFIKTVIRIEQNMVNGSEEIIGEYLRGEVGFSVLQSVSDKIGFKDVMYNTSYNNYDFMIMDALEMYPEYFDRYVSLKILQCMYRVNISINYYFRNACGYGRGDNETSEIVIKHRKRITDALIKENVPIQKRMELYESFSDYIYDDSLKRSAVEALIESMVEHSAAFDKEYEAVCKNGSLDLRKAYVEYLDRTNGEDNKNKDRLLSMCLDTSKEVRTVVVNLMSKHKEYEEDVVKLLSSKKQSVRDMAIEILSAWGADNYRDVFDKALETEKSAKITDKLIRILNVSGSEETLQNEISAERLVENLHKGGKNKKLLWLYENANPAVHFKSGEAADDKYMQAIMLCYANMQTAGRNDSALMLADKLNQDELSKFAVEIFSKWLSDGAESKKKWALYFSVIHGGDTMVEAALTYIKEWAENMRGAIAAEAVKAIAFNGSSLALMTVDNLAHKFKQKQVKKAAVEAMDTAAEALGITADELGDKIVPDLGFDENFQRIFDYGTRKFKVFINPALELEVYDENDKKLKTMPSPGKRDDEVTAKAANNEFKQMKKQLKNIIAIQKIRLEAVLLSNRRWSRDNWEKLFVKNPVMHSFAIGLIWAAYDGDNTVQTFRYMGDGSFNTVDEEEYELTDNVKIGLVHPIDLDGDTLSAWKEQLSDYEISQPIEQLERAVYRIKDEEIGKSDLERFSGRVLNGLSLIGRMSKFGWSNGQVQESGGFCVFYREDVTEKIKNPDGTVSLNVNTVELHFSGMYIGDYDEEVTIDNVSFYTHGTVQHGGYVNKAIMLDKVNPRYFSEIINQLEEITKQAV